MAEFITDKQLDEKLTDIIWNAKKELIILSPFIRLDDYCKNVVFKKLKNNPELEIIIVFGKNEGETQRSLTPTDLEIFKELSHITIIYCKNLHAKYYANENEALLTSLNLLGKSMTQNVEYGIYFQNSKLSLEKLYTDSISYTNQVIIENPCIYMKRPVFKKTNFGLTKKYVESKVIYDVTEALYKNRDFEKKYYEDFEYNILETETKPTRENYTHENRSLPNSKSIEINKEDVKKIKTDKNIFPLSNNDLEKIQRDFQKRFSEIKINSTNTYIFCKQLFPFADLMFREGFEIRFNKSVENSNQVLDIIEGLNFETTHFRYIINKNNLPYSILYIPQEVTDIQKLIYDYIFMANAIIDKTKSLKTESKFY